MTSNHQMEEESSLVITNKPRPVNAQCTLYRFLTYRDKSGRVREKTEPLSAATGACPAMQLWYIKLDACSLLSQAHLQEFHHG